MSTRGTRAWRFHHPDFDAESGRVGLSVTPTAGVTMVDGDASVRQALLLLLSTVPGERVMRPEYGCDLRRLVYSPNDDTTAGLAVHYVRRAVTRWEPRVELSRVDATRDEVDASRLNIHLEYRVRRTGAQARLELPMRLDGEVNR